MDTFKALTWEDIEALAKPVYGEAFKQALCKDMGYSPNAWRRWSDGMPAKAQAIFLPLIMKRLKENGAAIVQALKWLQDFEPKLFETQDEENSSLEK